MQLDQHRHAGYQPGRQLRRVIRAPRTASDDTGSRERRFGLAAAIGRLLGSNLPIAIECYDGSRIGPDDSDTTLVVRSPHALRYALTAPGELGIARAYVAGELDVEGDIFAALALRDNLPDVRLGAERVARPGAHRRRRGPAAAAAAARRGPPARPAALEGARRRPRSRTTTTSRTTSTGMVLGPSMTYSCGVWPSADAHARGRAGREVRARVPQARARARHAPARRRLRLGRHGHARGPAPRRARGRRHAVAPPGRVGAARGARGRASTTASRSACRTTATCATGPFDAISSIGMFEHVGAARLDEYFATLFDLVRPGRPAAQPRHRASGVDRRAAALRAPRLHRPLRVPRRRAARGRQRRVAHPARRLRGAPRRGPARALRADAARVGAQPRSDVGRGGRRGRRRTRTRVAALHGRVGDATSKPGARRSTRCSRCATTTARAASPLRPDWEPTHRAAREPAIHRNDHGPR